MTTKKRAILAGLLAALHAAPLAAQTVINADGTGEITTIIANTAGFGSGSHYNGAGFFLGIVGNDWFQFILPTTPITGAVLSIWNDPQNSTVDPAATFTLYGAAGFSFAGLQSGPAFASIGLAAANTGSGHFVALPLNGAGLAALNGALGGAFQFGGAVSSTASNDFSCNNCVSLFGYDTGNPHAYLTLATTTPVPEPMSLALLGSGLLALAGLRRRSAA